MFCLSTETSSQRGWRPDRMIRPTSSDCQHAYSAPYWTDDNTTAASRKRPPSLIGGSKSPLWWLHRTEMPSWQRWRIDNPLCSCCSIMNSFSTSWVWGRWRVHYLTRMCTGVSRQLWNNGRHFILLKFCYSLYNSQSLNDFLHTIPHKLCILADCYFKTCYWDHNFFTEVCLNVLGYITYPKIMVVKFSSGTYCIISISEN